MMSGTTVLTNALMTEKLTGGMVIRGMWTGCLEDCLQTGIWVLQSSTTSQNPPPLADWGGSVMEVINRYNSGVIQRITHASSAMSCQRAFRNNTWSVWRMLTS